MATIIDALTLTLALDPSQFTKGVKESQQASKNLKNRLFPKVRKLRPPPWLMRLLAILIDAMRPLNPPSFPCLLRECVAQLSPERFSGRDRLVSRAAARIERPSRRTPLLSPRLRSIRGRLVPKLCGPALRTACSR